MSMTFDTQAALLLTAPLILGRPWSGPEPLSGAESRRMLQLARAHHGALGDVLDDGSTVQHAAFAEFGADRLTALLGRGFLLAQVLETWHSRAIWVAGQTDPDYPTRALNRLGDHAPMLLYGCGDPGLLGTGGLAVVGSRHVGHDLIAYSEDVAELAAGAGVTVVSGGARGVDQAAMRAALASGGSVVGVLADSLGRAALDRDHRDFLIDSRLCMVSPYDPSAGFNVGNAMQRNKLVYALADVALVVSCELGSGGTWAGATEHLDRMRFIPVYVRPDPQSAGLEGLRRKGAVVWPDPQAPGDLAQIAAPQPDPSTTVVQAGLALSYAHEAPAEPYGSQATESVGDPETTADGRLMAALDTPHTEEQLAALLGVTVSEVSRDLRRLIRSGVVLKRGRPGRYSRRVPERSLFDPDN